MSCHPSSSGCSRKCSFLSSYFDVYFVTFRVYSGCTLSHVCVLIVPETKPAPTNNTTKTDSQPTILWQCNLWISILAVLYGDCVPYKVGIITACTPPDHHLIPEDSITRSVFTIKTFLNVFLKRNTRFSF